MANPIDRVIGWINPQAGLARYFARVRLQRAYEAASPRDAWRPRRAGASANADHLADAPAIRAKARALVQNVPYARAGLDALVSATIGTGIMPRGTGREADTVNRLFTAWSQVCDADGRLDYHGVVACAYRAMEQDGEVLVRLRPRLASDGLPVPLQLQLLEIDWLDSAKSGRSGANTIVNGIEYDPLGRIVSYWIFDSHPGELTFAHRMRGASHAVPATRIIHLFTSERPGQGRGFSRFASIIARVRDLQLYEDAELARKNLETRLSVLASGDLSSMANPAALGGAADTGAARTTGDLGQLASGSITEMPPGVNLTVVEPKPADGYVEYVKYQLHLIATGIGVPYEALTGDMKEVNFSSARVRLLDFRRAVDQMRWLVLVPRLLQPIHTAFVDAAMLAGKLRTRDLAVDYTTPKWDYVNPEQDVKADIAEINAGLASLSEKLRMRGYKPEDVYAEIASDFEKLKALGIHDMLLFKQQGKLPGDAQPQQSRALEAMAQVLDRMDTRMASIEQRPPAEVTVENHVQPASPAAVHNEIRNEPAAITVNVPPAEIHNEIRTEPPVINITTEAPAVNVHVPPAQVRVENTVQPAAVQLRMPARQTTGTVERDAQGRVLRTTQTEQDL